MADEEMIVDTIDNVEYTRTVDDVLDTLKLASVDESELVNVSQALNGKSNHDDRKIKLLELDKHLEKSILEGQTLSFKGESKDSLILCSNNRTYEVKEAETSNTLILIPGIKLFGELKNHSNTDWIVEQTETEGNFHTYFEVRECKPKLGNLLGLLNPSSFNGMEYERRVDISKLYTWEKLVSSIQASDEELKEAISQHMIVEIDGYYRLVGLKYEAQAILHMAEFMGANSWEPDEINKAETYEALEELIPKQVFDKIFHKYAKANDEKLNSENGEPLYTYDQAKICKIFAQVILMASPNTDYCDFMEAWHDATPDKITPKEEYLGGLALVVYNTQTGRKEVKSYPESDLSENIVERFNELFKVQSKWTVDQITPYITPLATKSLNVSALLTKYARPSIVNGVKCYSSKHGK